MPDMNGIEAVNIINEALEDQYDLVLMGVSLMPHRTVGAIAHNPAEGVMLLDEKK